MCANHSWNISYLWIVLFLFIIFFSLHGIDNIWILVRMAFKVKTLSLNGRTTSFGRLTSTLSRVNIWALFLWTIRIYPGGCNHASPSTCTGTLSSPTMVILTLRHWKQTETQVRYKAAETTGFTYFFKLKYIFWSLLHIQKKFYTETHRLRHALQKCVFKIFVIVIPKEGLVGRALPIHLLVWHWL